MKILTPTRITDAMLTSSSIPEPDAGEGLLWNVATTYAVGDMAYLNHRVYKALVDGAGKNPTAPVTTGDPVPWQDMGPTNRWAMFDEIVGSQSFGDSPLEVVLHPGGVSGVALLEMSARTAQVTMLDAPGGTVVYDREIDLDGTIINSFYDWFFADFEPMRDVVLTDLPGTFTNCELSLTLTTTSGDAGIGVFSVGQILDIGCTQPGASVGIIDYSRKERDAFGRTTVVERAYSKRANFTVMTGKADFNRIFRALARLRATPCVYIGADAQGYEPLLIYGFYRDFNIDVSYPRHHICTLQIEGLI